MTMTGAERVTREESLMAVAEVMAGRATCSRAAVGVVIAKEGRILSTGYNGAPAGMTHCQHPCTCVPEQVRDVMTGVIVRQIHEVACESQQPCEISVHAEANAIAWAARCGVSIKDSELYTTFSPCLPCAQLVVNSGITTVYFAREHRDNRGIQLLRTAPGMTLIGW